ncbi:MAG: hypothetical protein O7F71_01865 [Gammaproteobacteria bacterium]|nr:hypothetical protein [Gammaproteobacteria bacterium]
MAGKIAGTFIAILIGCAASAVCAKDQNGMFAVKGVGVLKCEAFIDAAEEGDRELAQYAGYLTGYVSAFNEVRPNTFDLLPWQHVDTVMLLMLQRCRRSPQMNFGSAVSGMARYFDQRKLTSLADRIPVGTGENGTELYEPVVAEIKAALVRWGYPTVELTASLKQFQADQKLSGEDAFGQRTLLKLLYGQKED